MAGPHLSLRLSDPITQRARHRIAHTDITTPQPQSLRPHGYNAPRRKRGEVATCGVSDSAVPSTRARRCRTRKQSREPIEHARPIAKPDQSPPPLVLRRDWPDAADGGSTCDGPRPSLRGCRPACEHAARPSAHPIPKPPPKRTDTTRPVLPRPARTPRPFNNRMVSECRRSAGGVGRAREGGGGAYGRDFARSRGSQPPALKKEKPENIRKW